MDREGLALQPPPVPPRAPRLGPAGADDLPRQPAPGLAPPHVVGVGLLAAAAPADRRLVAAGLEGADDVPQVPLGRGRAGIGYDPAPQGVVRLPVRLDLAGRRDGDAAAVQLGAQRCGDAERRRAGGPEEVVVVVAELRQVEEGDVVAEAEEDEVMQSAATPALTQPAQRKQREV